MKRVASILFAIAASASGATDLATRLEVARIDYDLPALEKPAGSDSLALRIFIQPALAYSAYALDGLLRVPEVGESGGSLTLVERTSQEGKKRVFALTHLQAREIFSWFHDAAFLVPKTKETIDTAVLDGDEMLIEGYFRGRYFRFRRNSGDSTASAAFFRSVNAFRIWKEEPNQPPEPMAGLAPGHGSP